MTMDKKMVRLLHTGRGKNPLKFHWVVVVESSDALLKEKREFRIMMIGYSSFQYL
jgi:hypothetical protein